MSLKKIKYNLIFNKHRDAVYNYAFSFLRSSFDADDVTQEIWIKYWERFETIDYSKSKSWIFRSIHNKCIDLLRVRKKEVTIMDDELFEIEDHRSETNPEKSGENKIMSEIIMDSIEKLPEKQRAIFQLFEIENFKYKEISQILEIPINSVKVYLMRARKNLQTLLKAEGVI